MSSGWSPATAMARRPATAAMLAVVSSGPAMRRSRIPVRLTIHSSVGLDHLLEVGVGQDLARGVGAPAGDVDAGHGTRPLRFHLDERLLRLHQLPGLGDDAHDPAGPVGLDLVEQLHGLDQADDLADGDRAGRR